MVYRQRHILLPSQRERTRYSVLDLHVHTKIINKQKPKEWRGGGGDCYLAAVQLVFGEYLNVGIFQARLAGARRNTLREVLPDANAAVAVQVWVVYREVDPTCGGVGINGCSGSKQMQSVDRNPYFEKRGQSRSADLSSGSGFPDNTYATC